MYDVWSQANCESHVDLIKMLGAVDFFLPYFPLEASNLRELFTKRLEDLAQQLHRREQLTLTWPTSVVEFLLSKVRLQRLICSMQACAALSVFTSALPTKPP